MSDYEFTEFVGRVMADQCRDGADLAAQVATLQQRVREQAETIRQLRAENGTLEFQLAEKQKGLDASELPRALAQFKQMFPGIDIGVSRGSEIGISSRGDVTA